ncbi:hypothetical protein AOLI_G00282410 [Acnodon oligacanthus]
MISTGAEGETAGSAGKLPTVSHASHDPPRRRSVTQSQLSQHNTHHTALTSLITRQSLAASDLPAEGSSSEVPILVVGSKRDLQRHRFTQRRAVSVLVKKTWKCGYVECSAKYNWHVLLLFKELLGIAVARGLRQNHASIRLQGALQRNRCSVM